MAADVEIDPTDQAPYVDVCADGRIMIESEDQDDFLILTLAEAIMLRDKLGRALNESNQRVGRAVQ
jgi:hypothetical protein